MKRHRITSMGTLAGLLGGMLLGACLPSMPEGERGRACWTDHATDRSSCVTTRIWCLDEADNDPNELQRCYDEANQCRAEAREELEFCEFRSGCVVQYSSCWEDCARLTDEDTRTSCEEVCELDFVSCAEWYDPECERLCRESATPCLAEADRSSERARCEDDRLECVLECY